MFVFQASKTFSRKCVPVGRLPNSSQTQLLLVAKRTKATEKCDTQKRPSPLDVCSPPPKDKRIPLSRKLLTLTGFALAGTAIVVVVAKNDDDFREWTKENAPKIDGLVKVLYQEEETYLEFLDSVYRELAKRLKGVLYNLFRGIKESGTKAIEPPIESPKVKKVINVFTFPDSAFLIEGENSNLEVPAHLKNLKQLESNLFKDAQEAMKAYNSATEALKESVNFIRNLDQLVSRHDCKLWDRLKKRTEDVKEFSEKFEQGSDKVKESAEYLQMQMNKTPSLTLDVKQKAENNIMYTLDTINRAKENLNKEKTNPILPSDKVKDARVYFYDKLQTFFPNLWLNDEKLKLPEDNVPPFIEHLLQLMQEAEKNLNKFQTIREPEVNNAIEIARSYDNEESKNNIVHTYVKIEKERENRFKKEELQKALQEYQTNHEKENKEALKKLAEVYNELKHEALVTSEREVERRMQLQLEKRLAELRANHQLVVAKMVGRIQGANEAISSRGEKEKSQQEKQQFWSAAQSLLSAVKHIGTSDKAKAPKPLKSEILNITKAAPDGDEVVKSVVDSIPATAIEQGVSSKECLKRRFLQVDKEAHHLAGVPTGSVSLLQLALARIQSALYIDLPIPQSELNNEPIDVEELNNYQLLQRARYYVNHGELDQAVRYLNLLKGPSAKAASCWIKDAVTYMETVQAAELLLAYASAFNQ